MIASVRELFCVVAIVLRYEKVAGRINREREKRMWGLMNMVSRKKVSLLNLCDIPATEFGGDVENAGDAINYGG